MKCKKCLSEWSSSIKSERCPFCGEILESKTTSDFLSFEQVLKYIVDTFGAETYNKPSAFLSYVSDFAPTFVDERRLLKFCSEADVFRIMLEAKEKDATEQQDIQRKIAHELQSHYFLNKEMSEKAVYWIAFSLELNTITAKGPNGFVHQYDDSKSKSPDEDKSKITVSQKQEAYLTCPTCGWPVEYGEKECPAGHPVFHFAGKTEERIRNGQNDTNKISRSSLYSIIRHDGFEKLNSLSSKTNEEDSFSSMKHKSFSNSYTYTETISAGTWHTVGLKNDGTVISTEFVAEKKFDWGQCNVSNWKDIVAISASASHTVGLVSNGTVVATRYISGELGSNYGQCNVSNWRDIVAISASEHHTVGLKSDGTVVVTSPIEPKYNYGQCNVNAWKNIVSISAGSYHTVGLKSDGTVVSTLITGDLRVDWEQCNVNTWRDIVAISAAGHLTVGLKSDGTVVVTGSLEFFTYSTNKTMKDIINILKSWKNITSISISNRHIVGLKSDGTVVACGCNTNGQCNVSNWKDIVAISAGYKHTIGLKSNGTVIATEHTGKELYGGECNVYNWKNIKI